MSRRSGAIALALLLGGLALALLVRAPRTHLPIAVGLLAPGLALPSLADGERVTLAGLRGRVVLVNFWATWCKPCEEEMPAMERLYAALSDEPFELLAVSVDAGRDEVAAFQAELRLSFPILLDPAKEAARAYQSSRFPESFLVDRDGTLVARYIGPRVWDSPEYEARIRRLIAGEG